MDEGVAIVPSSILSGQSEEQRRARHYVELVKNVLKLYDSGILTLAEAVQDLNMAIAGANDAISEMDLFDKEISIS